MTLRSQVSFSSGEVSPSLYARVDLARYQIALRTCRNLICLRDGGAANRPGTEFVGLTPTTGAVWVRPFVFNDAQSYVLEFSHLKLRIIQDGAYIGAPYEVVTTYAAADLGSLQFTQDADVLTIVHPNHPVRELARVSALVWTLTDVVFGPDIAAPSGIAMTPATGAGTFDQWVVTAVSERTGAESYPSTVVGVSSISLPIAREISWNAVAGASVYHIYKGRSPNGLPSVSYGYVGSSSSTNFYDDGITADDLDQPPAVRSLFDAVGEYPGAVAHYQQRRILAGSDTEPETFHTSRTAELANFTKSTPIQDDDAITATLKAKKVNRILHLVDADALYALTSGGEWKIRGDGEGILRPTDINALNFSKHGAGPLAPIVIDRRILYVQARGAIVREIVSNDVGDGYLGNNLTLLSSHLFKGHSLVDWAYQEEPYSVLWCVRSDGVLLGLTTLEEQQVLAWHRHDTDGLVESVCVIPEGNEERLYLVVNRGGVRMVERMASRNYTDVEDAVFMDSALSYDGRNTTAVTMTLSGSTSWENDEELTITRSAAGFTAGDVGNRIDLMAYDGEAVRVTLSGYTSATVMTGFPHRTVPADLQSMGTSEWTRAVDTLTGLSHLNGKAVSVTGDGYVIASPNNPAYATTVTVVGGSVTLPAPAGYVRVGLPYVCDLETLDLASDKDRKLLANGLVCYLEASKGGFAGQSLPTGADLVEHMDELKSREASDEYDAIALRTDTFETVFPSRWNTNGRVAIRHVDPAPLTVLAIMPRGTIG